MALVNWQLFDRIRAMMRKSNIYQQDRNYADQSDMSRIAAGSNLLELTKASGLLDQTNLQINRLERYKDYDMMDEVGEITLALDLYADEASLVSPEDKHTVIVKSKSKKVKEELENLLYNTLLLNRDSRPIVRYLCKYGDFAAEIVPNKNRDGVSSIRFISVYNFTRVQTKLGDLVGFFYQDPNSLQPIFLHPWQVMHLRLTSFETVYTPYGRCQDIDGPIWTPNGYKKLRDIQKGDEVYSFDLINQKPVVTKVLDKVLSGKKKTFVIKTKHRSIRVTPEHPVLSIINNITITYMFNTDKNKPHVRKQHKRDITTKQYVLAQDLKLGDKLILPKLHNEGIDIPIEKYYIDENKIGKRLQIPNQVTKDFAKLMGFLIGDGWIPTHNNQKLFFAEGEYFELNRKYIDIIKSFGYNEEPNYKSGKISKYGQYSFNSIELSQTIANMGLVGKCYEKRIPKWVFVAKEDIKKAFIEGLVDSDGSTNIDEWGCERFQIELTSEELVRDLKILLDQMNIKCGNVSKRNRPSKFTIIHNEEYERSDSWILYWYNSKMPYGHMLHKGDGAYYQNDSEDFLVESIISIEDGGEVEVGDIQVSEHSNFIANGVVIHNSILDGSRKDFKRLRLMEDAALIYRLTRAPEKRIFSIPIGNIPPNQVHHYITEIARTFKKHKFVDPATGQVNERYSPLIQEDDFFLPTRPDGQGPKIETLPGAANLDQIEDILYFKKKMIAGTKIPFSRVGIGEQTDADSKSVASSSPEFAKAVQWIQREVSLGLKKICIVHLAMKGYSINEIRDFDLTMCAASAIDELYRIETWNTRAEIINNLHDTKLFPNEWILRKFTDLTDDEISSMEAKTKKESQEGQPEIAAPGALGIGEAVDEEDKQLILEYNDYLNTAKVKHKKKETMESADASWFVNNNELDMLPRMHGEKSDGKTELIVESVLDEKLRAEVISEYEKLLSATSYSTIEEIADNITISIDDVPKQNDKLIVESDDAQKQK